MNDPNKTFDKNIRQVLNQSIEDLDLETAVKVGQLKYHALDTSRKRSSRLVWGAVPATVVALLLVFLLNGQQKNSLQQISSDITELSILTATDTLDFYAEEIEFYEWLSEVLENETDLSDLRGDLSTFFAPDLVLGSGIKRRNSSECGITGIPGDFRG